MDKRKIFLCIVALFIALVHSFHRDIIAGETEKDLGNSERKNKVKVIVPSDVSKEDLKKIKKIAVSVTSTSPLFGGAAEDLLAVKLRDNGFDVVEKSKVSELTLQELRSKELRELEKQLDLEKQLEKGKLELEKESEKSQKEMLTMTDIGKKLGLDAVMMGTLFEGRRQDSFIHSKKEQTTMEKIVVSTFYLQVINIRSEKVVIAIILEYDMGEDLINAIDIMIKYIKEEIKG